MNLPKSSKSRRISPSESSSLELASKFNVKDSSEIWTFIDSIGPLVIRKLLIDINDHGPVIKTTITMENPTLLDFFLKKIQFRLIIEGEAFADVILENFGLSQGMNDLNLQLGFDFLDPEISEVGFSRAISKVLNRLLVQGEKMLNVSIVGPILVNDSNFFSKFTNIC